MKDFVSAPFIIRLSSVVMYIENKYREEPCRTESFQPLNEQPETTVLSIVSTGTSGLEHILLCK